MYCLSISKKQKEVFQVYFYLYCTLIEIKHNYKKYFNLQYTVTSKKANILTIHHQVKSFPVINYILLISFYAY